MNFVQIASDAYVDAADVKRIFSDPDHRQVYIACTGFGVPGFDTHVILSDWSIDRVRNALGLIDADVLDKMIES